jgi:hypothetical protein
MSRAKKVTSLSNVLDYSSRRRLGRNAPEAVMLQVNRQILVRPGSSKAGTSDMVLPLTLPRARIDANCIPILSDVSATSTQK